jgi:hypothetical protein
MGRAMMGQGSIPPHIALLQKIENNHNYSIFFEKN